MQRMTRQRAAVLELLGEIPDFKSAQGWHEELAARGQKVGIATVYRTLQTLAEKGEVDVLRVGDEALFRMCETAHHHHHLVCRSCGHTVELDGGAIEKWVKSIGEETGFTDVDHTLEFVGLCRTCRESAS